MSGSWLRREWDFALMVATIALLGSLGIQSFIGTAYVWWAENTIPGWMQTGYAGYVTLMNAIAAPQVVLLVIAMGLCVPKRLFTRNALIAVSGAMVLAGFAVWAFTGSLVDGLTVYLGLAALIQVAVNAMILAGIRGPSYLTESRIVKAGSGLLHLGFILFAIVAVALERSPLLLPVFWTSTAMICVGTLMSFYASRLAVKRIKRVEVETSF